MKRVLIITYYWPPSGGISVLRSLKIVKYLRKFGWEPVVYAPSNALYPYLDENGAKDIPDDLEIIKRPIVEPFGMFKWLTGRRKNDPLNSIVQIKDRKSSILDKLGIYIRGNFFIPDARFLWIKPSVRFLTKYLKSNPVDAIFTDGPPHTNTYIACLLKENLGIPWLADFQDPWTQVDYLQMMPLSKRAWKLHRKMEQRCFALADKTTIASPSWKKDLESIGAKNVDVIYYGYDEDDFKGLSKIESDQFRIVHIGLLGIDRDPTTAIKEIVELVDRDIVLELAGQVDSQVLSRLQSIEGLVVDNKGAIPREEALKLAINASLLLLPINKAANAQGRLPGKLYEYLRTQNLILALGPTGSDAAKIISETGTGGCVEYEDTFGVRKFINTHVLTEKQQIPDQNKIESYSNKNQTRKVAGYLNEMA